MDKQHFIVVSGINSKIELKIDLDILATMLKVFLQDSPREAREISQVIKIMEFYREITDLLNSEIAAADKKIAEKMMSMELDVAEGEVDNTETVNTFEENMLKFYRKDE
jgi:hypothetical protein